MSLRSFIILVIFSLFFAGAIPSCTVKEKAPAKTQKEILPKSRIRSFKIITPSSSEKIVLGNSFKLSLECNDPALKTDSVEVFLDASLMSVFKANELSGDISTIDVLPGVRQIRTIVHYNSGNNETCVSRIIVLSDIIPQNYSYSVVNTFPHDIGAYTQGFEFFKGYIYEGTGQYNESSLRKTELRTGQILKARNLPGDIFGEGITIFNNKIYQITYRSQVGFVYDLTTFELLQKIYYQNQEGWGLTNDGTSIIMSDGTNNLYFMDPEYFHVLRKLEVMDHNGPVDAINEMEWIDGKIWANRYHTDEIVIIDPKSGKIEGKVDMSGLLPPEHRHPKIDVLNGIAWDEENRRLFVTGKYWPNIFEIKLIKTIAK